MAIGWDSVAHVFELALLVKLVRRPRVDAPEPQSVAVTHPAMTLRLCDAHGVLLGERTIHQADPPEQVLFQGATFEYYATDDAVTLDYRETHG